MTDQCIGRCTDVAVGAPRNPITELGGPRPEDLVDMTRRFLAARGEPLDLQPAGTFGPFDTDMSGDILLVSPDARTPGPTSPHGSADYWFAVPLPAWV